MISDAKLDHDRSDYELILFSTASNNSRVKIYMGHFTPNWKIINNFNFQFPSFFDIDVMSIKKPFLVNFEIFLITRLKDTAIF